MASDKREGNNLFAALQYKNFRRYWLGMCVSVIGTWMQNIAQPWLAYTLTDSPLLLSLVSMAQFIPVLLFSLPAGVIIDKFPKKLIIMLTQSASLAITLLLGVLVWSERIRYWHILVLALLLGMVNTLDMPARHAFVPQLTEKKSLMNAIALNSISFNLGRIVGPGIAGLVMGSFGIAMCFFINAVSYAMVLVSLFTIKTWTPETIPGIREAKLLTQVEDGLNYIRQNRELLQILLLVASVTIFAGNNSVLVPVYTQKILGLGETYFGVIMSLMGGGSFLGAMCIAGLSKIGPRKKAVTVTPYLIALSIGVTGLTGHYALTGLTLAMSGFFFILFSSNANTMIQLKVEDVYRGRVMSVYNLVFGGTLPIGNMIAGLVVDRCNARAGFYVCGISIAVLSMLLTGLYHRLHL